MVFKSLTDVRAEFDIVGIVTFGPLSVIKVIEHPDTPTGESARSQKTPEILRERPGPNRAPGLAHRIVKEIQ